MSDNAANRSAELTNLTETELLGVNGGNWWSNSQQWGGGGQGQGQVPGGGQGQGQVWGGWSWRW